MRKAEIIKNVGSSWFSLGTSILVGIFLSPFILHRLGDTAYGIWILIFSVTGYYGLFDLGIRSSVIRYVSTYTATGDQEGLTKLINTALATYTAIGSVAMKPPPCRDPTAADGTTPEDPAPTLCRPREPRSALPAIRPARARPK